MVPVGTWVKYNDDLSIDDEWVEHKGKVLVAGYTYFEDVLYYEVLTKCGKASQVHHRDLERDDD